MSVPLESREKILGRVRAATKSVARNPGELEGAYAALERGYVREGKLSGDERLDLMITRLREYDAEVVECAPNEVAAAIAAQLAASGKKKFVAPAGLPAAWLAEGFDWKVDHGLTSAEIEEAEGVVTGSFCGIADSGTIVLHHSATEGRRVLTLLPDWHLIVLRSSQVVETLPEYFARCERAAAPGPSEIGPICSEEPEKYTSGAKAHDDLIDFSARLKSCPDTKPSSVGDRERLSAPCLATYISGPSATADIEMTRIKGVHGPRFLHVVVVRDSEQ